MSICSKMNCSIRPTFLFAFQILKIRQLIDSGKIETKREFICVFPLLCVYAFTLTIDLRMCNSLHALKKKIVSSRHCLFHCCCYHRCSSLRPCTTFIRDSPIFPLFFFFFCSAKTRKNFHSFCRPSISVSDHIFFSVAFLFVPIACVFSCFVYAREKRSNDFVVSYNRKRKNLLESHKFSSQSPSI